jgi:uncharacterized NAD(P)/FAD-binding protein YdhS
MGPIVVKLEADLADVDVVWTFRDLSERQQIWSVSRRAKSRGYVPEQVR